MSRAPVSLRFALETTIAPSGKTPEACRITSRTLPDSSTSRGERALRCCRSLASALWRALLTNQRRRETDAEAWSEM
jgi:hypothetical protein